MVNMNQFTLYCQGESYLDRRKYDQATTNERADNRLQQDLMQQLNRANQGPLLPQAQPFVQQGLSLPRFAQQFFQVMAQPFQPVIQAVQALAQRVVNSLPPQAQAAIAALTRVADQVMGQIASFFIGDQKTREKDREDREVHSRDLNENADMDLFIKKTTEITAAKGGGMGG